MATRSRTATLDDRPTSASGPGSDWLAAKTGVHEYDKRKSRDDLYLTLNADKLRYKSFHIPRWQVPSPPSVSYSGGWHPGTGRAEAEVEAESARRGSSTTTDSLGKHGDTGFIAIGMALGSPSQAPPGTTWRPQLATVMSPRSAGTSAEAQDSAEETTPKSRTPRVWGLFRSKSRARRAKTNPETSSPRSKLESPEHFNVRSPPGVVPRVQPGPGPAGVSRTGSLAANSSKYKPLVVRSNTEPINGGGYEVRSPPQPNRAAPRPPHIPIHTPPARQVERPTPPAAFHLPASRGPFLDVQIPDITMERYSIMFGQVLQNRPPSYQQQHSQQPPPQPQQSQRQQPQVQQTQTQQTQPQKPQRQPPQQTPLRHPPRPPSQQPPQLQDTSSSSLLVRRQANLGKLKTIDDESLQTTSPELSRPRRATSPQPKSSPAFHLFPPTKPTGPQTQSPRLRSNTSPAGLAPLSQATLDEDPPRMPPPRVHTLPRHNHSNSSAETLPAHPAVKRRPVPPAPSRLQHVTPPTRSNPIFDSPTSLEEPAPEMKATYQPSTKEPAWDMISPPASTASSEADTPPKKGSISSITSAAEQITVVNQLHEESETDRALREAVEASITRQISVSREQRQLLGSLRGQTGGRRPSNSAKALGFGPITAVGKDERLAETKRLVPTLVHPEVQSDDSPRSLHMHRKSERVILEG